MRPGFDSEKYLEEQSHAILERAAKFGDKLYLEFGGHEHCYCRSTPGRKTLFCNSPKLQRYSAWDLPFPVVLNDYCAHLELSRRGDILTVRAFDSTGEHIDSFPVTRIGTK